MPAVMPVAGRRSWLPVDIGNVRITNGLIRAGIAPSSPTVHNRIRIEMWNGTTWGGVYFDALVGVVGGSWITPFNMNTCQVLRNSVEEVAVRYTGVFDLVTDGLCQMDLSVRRGVPILYVDVASLNTTAVWRARTNLASADYPLGSSLSGYVQSTAAFNTSLYPFVTGGYATTTNHADGEVAQSSATTGATFGFGFGSSSGDTAGVEPFYRSLSESVRVVEF